ncbi:TPA: hypothetical protein I8Y00_005305 [Citrobacter farmeri]|uniref:Uncharacterized protein n=3 Tax=Citrobacter TaxID=544 RepID=A0AAP9QIF8_CITFR|nr:MULTISPECIES: hypothetical protein [Enterobacteriaceae]EBS1368590.1 hypothetical protein [Salmonella enterica subsp. enterica serovar Virchow]HBB6717198.1 hypothetical protein [Serratia marcescens]EHK0948265.1 hypothetical protein [Citrobacter farmeri]EKT9197354.1 hypothetical protein [Citrobacter freundii]EKX4543609.1 hypothetical protein [Citrobacter farmeri]
MITTNVLNALSETVFINTQRKSTKKFDFTVTRNNDGSYLVSQQAYRVYPSGHEVMKSSKTWVAENIQMLRKSAFMNNRQGRIFLKSIAIH